MIKDVLLKPITTALLFMLVLYQANAQTTISGNILNSKDSTGIDGVSISVKNSKTGTITLANGQFKVNVPTLPVTLIATSVGFSTQEFNVSSANPVTIYLTAAASNTLNDIVVIGYGTAKKKDLTGAVANISSKDLNQGPSTNVLQQIAGKASGVNITQTGSEPGSAPSVRIRGISSLIGGNDPLVVVDGVQGNMDLLRQVPPSEIESVDILKDASATAIYGSRGGPGVIIVTTKKTKAGNSFLEYSSNLSYEVITKAPKMMNADQWWDQAQKWGVPASTNHGSNTDWFDILTQAGSTQNHSLSFGGSGANGFNYRASLAAILQNGVVINSKYKNYIGRIQAVQKALDNKLTITMNLNTSIANTVGSPGSVGRAAFTSNLISNSYISKPTDPVYNADGTYFTDPTVFQYINPYAVAQTAVNEGGTDNLFGTLRTDLQITKSLSAGWFGSWRKVSNNWGYYLPPKSTVADAIDNKGVANIRNDKRDEKLMNISLGFKKTIGAHAIDAIAVYEWQRHTDQGNFTQTKGFINDITRYDALQFASTVTPDDISSYKNDRSLISFLGRVNYSFRSKYLVTLSIRRDGSSVFGTNYHWGNFPSASVAWRVLEESFMQNQKIFSDLKLRAGYGVTGNQQGLKPNTSQQLAGKPPKYGPVPTTVYFAGKIIPNFVIIQNYNYDLRWETKTQTNIGIDFGLFDNKLSGTIEAYTATTKNLLFDYGVPTPPFPYANIKANVGSLLNKGLELQLNYKAINNKDLTLTVGGNVTLMKNKILELNGSINGVPLTSNYIPWGAPNSMLIIGQPIGTFNILESAGRDPYNGKEIVADRNKDSIIDQGSMSEDRVMKGSALPTYSFSVYPSVTYKNWDMSMLWRGSGGNKAYNTLRKSLSLYEALGKSNLLNSARSLGLFTSEYASDLWLEDASFIRWDNLTIGYRVDLKKIKHVSAIRISATGNNLAIITKYSGLDPELIIDGGSGAGFGRDNGIYPRTRNYSIGLNVIFK